MSFDVKKRIGRSALFAAVLLIAAMVCVVLCLPKTAASAEEVALSAIYRLDFADENARLKNTGSNTSLPAATEVSDGGVTYEQSAHGVAACVANSSNEKVRSNYIKLPSVVNGDSMTVAGWFYVDSDTHEWSRMLEISNGKSNDELYRIMVMPYHGNVYNGLNVNVELAGVRQNGVDNNDSFIFGGRDNDTPTVNNEGAKANMPIDTKTLPLYNGWMHYAFEITPTALKIYRNGVLTKEKECAFGSASKFFDATTGYISLGATFSDGTADFTGKYADIRIYDSALTAEQINAEYGFTYTDFLTASYDFEDGVKDGARGFDGTLTGSASIEEKMGNHTLKVDGVQNDDHFLRSGFVIPGKAIHGHDELTLSTDINISSETGWWSYIFFARAVSTASSMTGFATKFGGDKTTLLKHTKNGDAAAKSLSTQDVPFDKWVNLTFVLDGKAGVLYLDGTEIARNDDLPYSDNIFWDNRGETGLIGFGRNVGYNDAPIKAEYDNIKIYNKALNAKEVRLSAGLWKEADDGKAIATEKAKLDVSWDGSASGISLPTTLGDGVTVAWTSSHPEVISTAGVVTPKQYEDTTVTLTAVFARWAKTETATYEITVPAPPYLTKKNDISVESVGDGSTIDLKNYVNTNVDGAWSYTYKDVETQGYEFTVPSESVENGTITLSVTPTGGEKLSVDLTLNVSYTPTPTKYTVTVKSEGTTLETKSVNSGTEIDLSAYSPTREGYRLKEWSDGAATYAVNGKVTVTANMTITAVWEKLTYTIKVLYGQEELYNQTIEHGEAINFVAPEKSGYTFDGLYSDAELTVPATMPQVASGDITLYAKYTENTPEPPDPPAPIKYTVTVKSEDNTLDTKSVNSGTEIDLSAYSPTREGYRLKEWSDGAATYASNGKVTVTANMTITAVWVKLSYTVKVMYGQEELYNQTIEHGEAINFVAPEKSGYTFDGLYSDAELTVPATMPQVASGDITLYAKYTAVTPPDEPDPPTPSDTVVSVVIGNADASVTVKADGTVEYSAPQVAGKKFEGLYIDAEFSVKATAQNINTGMTLYPKYVDDAVTPAPDDDNKPSENPSGEGGEDGGDGVNLGLAVGLPVGLVCAAAICIGVAIAIRRKKRNAHDDKEA